MGRRGRGWQGERGRWGRRVRGEVRGVRVRVRVVRGGLTFHERVVDRQDRRNRSTVGRGGDGRIVGIQRRGE